MNKATVVVLVIASFIIGLLVPEAPYVGNKVSQVLSSLGLASTTPAENGAVTRVAKETVTETVTSTVTLTTTKETTIAKTVYRTVTQTLRETITKTVTEHATTRTTITVTVTVTSTPREQPVAERAPTPSTYKELRELIEGPPLPVLGPQAYSYVGVRLYAGKYLVIERPRYPGYYVATIYVEAETTTRYLVPCCLETSDMLPPSILIANETLFAEYYSAKSLSEFLGNGVYTIDVPIDKGHAIECKLLVREDSVTLTNCKQVLVEVRGPKLSGYPSLLDAVLGSYNETLFAKLRTIIYGNKVVRDPAQAAWSILRWEHTHISYDYAKEERRDPTVYSPLQLLKRGSGICSDYAVFTAAALLASSQKTAYIIAINTKPVPHAVAATNLDNTLFILDQHPPPIEAGDYAEYLLGNKTLPAYIIRVTRTSSGISIKAYKAKLSPQLDTYPADKIPEETIEEARRIISRETGTIPARELETVIETGKVYTYINRYLEPLAGITQHPVPLGALYSPLLDKEWANEIAETAKTIIQQYYPRALGKGSFWLTVTQTPRVTSIKVYAIPFREPRVTIATSQDTITITIETEQPINPETDIQLIIYNNDKTICAAIAPPGYTYPGTPTITAKQWIKTGNTITIAIDKRAITDTTKECNNPVLDIWMKQAIIYSLEVPKAST